MPKTGSSCHLTFATMKHFHADSVFRFKFFIKIIIFFANAKILANYFRNQINLKILFKIF